MVRPILFVGVCVYKHICLFELISSEFYLGPVPHPCVQYATCSCQPRWEAVWISWAIPVMEIWPGTLHISTGKLFLLQCLQDSFVTNLLSPKHYYLFLLCLHQYYSQHIKGFSKAYRCRLGPCQPCCLVICIHVLS